MTTMLEKMARGACRGDGEKPDEVWYEFKSDDGTVLAAPLLWQRYLPVVRSALRAIREPDEALCEIAAEAANEARDNDVEFFCTRAMFRDGHQAMIDAILNEKPEAGTT